MLLSQEMFEISVYHLPTVLSVAAFAVFVRLFLRHRHLVSVTPPGPTPIPFLGNIFDIPVDEPWLKYNEWAKKYHSMSNI
jgi:hypothetical protein